MVVHIGSTSAEGARYKYYTKFTSNNNRIKKDTGGTARNWWLRSPAYNPTNCFMHIEPDGTASSFYPATAYYISPGFSI